MSVKLGELYYELGIEDLTKRDLQVAQRGVQKWERATTATVQVGADWRDARSELKAAGDAVDKLDGTTAKVRVDGDGSRAERAIDDVAGAFDDLQAEVDGNPIAPTVDTSKIDDGAATGRRSLLDMIGGWKTAAVAAAAIGGAAVADKFIEGFNSVVEANRENDRLAASLGLSDDEATVAGRLAGDLWVDAFGESTGQVNDAVRAGLLAMQGLDVGSDFGTNAAELRTITENALNLASVFDVDVADSIATASLLVRNGLANSMTEAFDLIYASAQKVPAAMTGDLLDAVNEYGPLLGALGLSGEQFFGMLVSASGDGTIAVDKVGDALKEFSIRATDMSATSTAAYGTIGLDAKKMSDMVLAGGEQGRKAFDMIVDGLLSIEDPTTRANTAIALFGTPLEDLGVSQIPAFLRGLKDGKGSLGDFRGAAADAGRELNDNLATDIDEVVRKLSPASLAQAFDQGGIEGLKARVQEGVDKLKSIWDEYGPAVGAAFSALSEVWDEKGPEVIAALSAWWADKGGPAAEEAVSAAFGVAWEGVQAWFAEKVKDPDWWADLVLNSLYGPFKDAMIAKSVEMGVAATEWVKGIPGLVAELASGAWDGLLDSFEGVINAIINGWNNISFTLPEIDPFGDYGPSVGGQTVSVPQISTIDIGRPNTPHRTVLGGQHAPPEFAKGGFVDAPVGKPLLAILHGGEYVNTADEVSRGAIGAPGPRKGAGRRSHGFRDLHVHTGGNPTARAVGDAVDRRVMGWS